MRSNSSAVARRVLARAGTRVRWWDPRAQCAVGRWRVAREASWGGVGVEGTPAVCAQTAVSDAGACDVIRNGTRRTTGGQRTQAEVRARFDTKI